MDMEMVTGFVSRMATELGFMESKDNNLGIGMVNWEFLKWF
jgi:hypothetical protein